MEDHYVKCMELIGKLQRNMEQISPEDAKGKYRRALQKLKQQISEEWGILAKHSLCAQLEFLSDADKDDFLRELNEMLEEEAPVVKKISRALYREYSLDRAMILFDEILTKKRVLYQGYFARTGYTDEEGIKSPFLPGYIWVPKEQLWYSREKKEFCGGFLPYIERETANAYM